MFVGYEGGESLTPDMRNWQTDVCALYVSWQGRSPEYTIRSLLRANFPEAKVLADLDLMGCKSTPQSNPMDTTSRGVQTTERIYTFPIQLPTALATESVSWGEPAIKNSTMSPGELWHTRLVHVSDNIMAATATAYPFFEMPKRHVTNKKDQAAVCVSVVHGAKRLSSTRSSQARTRQHNT